MKEIGDLKEFAAFARRMPVLQRMSQAGKLADDAVEKTVALVERLDERIGRLEFLIAEARSTAAGAQALADVNARRVARHQAALAAMIGESNATEVARVRAIFEGGDNA